MRSAVVAFLLFFLNASAVVAETRVALVVGNEAYQYMPALANPARDAESIGQTLASVGFDTMVVKNANSASMNDALNQFSRKVAGADVAIFYYSGHGMQFNGRNYLLPINANLRDAGDVNRRELTLVDDVIDVLTLTSGLKLLVLDACRTNAVERDFKDRFESGGRLTRDAATTRGFARVPPRSGLIIAYATQADDVAADGAGLHSPFTTAFLDNVVLGDVEIRQMLNKVQSEVYDLTKHTQLPEISSLYVGPEIKLNRMQASANAAPARSPLPTSNVEALASLPPSQPTFPVPARDFIIPDSDRRMLSADELRHFTKGDLRIARNEIFARRGRYFEAPDLKARFANFSWYAPVTWNPELSQIEKANVALIEHLEAGNGAAAPGFIFSDSDRRLITTAELARLSASDLRIARNEIFARRGRYFDSADLKTYFAQYSWYVPTTWNPKLNSFEAANVALMDSMEKRRQ